MNSAMNDAQLIRFAADFRRGILGRDGSDSMCFAVCAPLVTLLNMSGVEATLKEGTVKLFSIGHGNHFWIELADGRVLDPTADQFNRIRKAKLPKVYLGSAVADLHIPVAVKRTADG